MVDSIRWMDPRVFADRYGGAGHRLWQSLVRYTRSRRPQSHVIKWTAILSWLGTVVGGLFAGKSNKTTGEGASKSPPLQILAQAAGLLFLIGISLATAELLYLFFGVWLSPPANGPSSVIASTGWQLLLRTKRRFSCFAAGYAPNGSRSTSLD